MRRRAGLCCFRDAPAPHPPAAPRCQLSRSLSPVVGAAQCLPPAGGVYPEEGRVTSRGTKQRPAVVRVRTQDRADKILALCQEHGIQVIVGIEPDETEDISDVERILWPPVPAVAAAKVGRNDPCPCGSGKKYKKCCAGPASGA